MAFFSKKGVWHSYLKAQSPVVVRFKNPPIVSKYPNREGEDQWVVYFQVRGDSSPEDYYYYIEDDEILEKLNNVEYGTWYSVSAGGGKDGQWLNIEPAGESTNAVKASGPSYDDSYSAGYISGDYVKCLEEAKGIAGTVLDTEDPSVIQSIAATLYINWSKSGFRVPLNADDAPEREYVDEDNTDKYTKKVQDLISKLNRRSGKAHDGKALKTAIDKIEAALDGHIDAQTFGKIAEWLNNEVTYQNNDDEEPKDELPF